MRRKQTAIGFGLLALGLCIEVAVFWQERRVTPDGVRATRSAPASASIRVANLREGETLRYAVALLIGETRASLKSAEVRVVNQNNPSLNGTYCAPIQKGRFKALVELVPGINRLRLSAGQEQAMLTLQYRPMTTRYRVNILFALASDSPDSPSELARLYPRYREKLDTAAKLMQTFTAESMHRQGYGRKTFALEQDANGRVVVHLLRLPLAAAQMRSASQKNAYRLYELIYPKVQEEFPDTKHQNLVFSSVRGEDFGLGDVGMGLVDTTSLQEWPTRLQNVANAEEDSMAAWRLGIIGGALHELGHCFGADHSADPMSVMSAGCYYFNRMFTVTETDWREANQGERVFYTEREEAYWEPYIAGQFAHHRWFQPDERVFRAEKRPSITLDTARQEIVIRAPYGIGIVQIYGPGEGKPEDYPPPKQRHHQVYTRNHPTEVRYPRTKLRQMAAAPQGATVRVVDCDGNIEEQNEADLPLP
jgi:hypothetical protein